MTMVALLTMTVAVAQESDNNKQRREFKKPTPEEMTNRMAENLKLDDKQKSKVLDLNKEYESVLMGPGMGRGLGRGHRGGPRPDGETGATQKDNEQKADKQQAPRRQRPELTDEQKAQMKQMMEKRQEYDKKLKEILTDEQYKTYQEQHQRRGRGGFGGPRGPRGQRPDMQ